MQSIIRLKSGSLRWKMLEVLMCILSGAGIIVVVQYLGKGIRQKKYGKSKKAVNDELIELLKE